jgi:translation initiation factor 1
MELRSSRRLLPWAPDSRRCCSPQSANLTPARKWLVGKRPVADDHAVTARSNTRLVYSTDTGGVCGGCGWPRRDCKCSRPRAGTEPVPTRIVAKLRMEKKGRGGKTVTVVYGLPRNTAFLKSLCGDLKRSCGTGGAVLDDGVEVQGKLRDRVRDVLEKKGFLVKG